jgi:ADP-heptose:LPS heptosyltransferase
MDRKIVRLAPVGGLGDVLLGTPVYRTLKKIDGNSRIKVYCRSRMALELLKGNPYIDKLWTLPFRKTFYRYIDAYLRRKGYHFMHYGIDASLFTGKNASDMIAEILGIQQQDNKLEIYLTKKEDARARSQLSEYRNPIIIHGCAFTSDNKNWSVQSWEQLIREMPDYTFIQLGLAQEAKLAGAIDLRGKTSIRESIALIKCCLSFIGVDSSLSHATNAFDVAGVVLFGPSTPLVWGHSNNINLYKGTRCSPCIDTLRASCCPYEKKCMQTIDVQDVKAALLAQINKKQMILT